jgi:hypothetical protein
MSRFGSRGSSGGTQGVVIIIILICCFSFVVGSVYGVAEISDKSKTGIETIQELINGTKTLKNVLDGALDETPKVDPATANKMREDMGLDPIAFDCEGNFLQWGVCDKTCGTGTQTRTFTVKTDELAGGLCPNRDVVEERDCNTQPCAVDCEGEFVDNRMRLGAVPCAFGCGPENKSVIYNITTPRAYGGRVCPHTEGEVKDVECGNPACPVIDTTETIDGIQYEVKYYDDDPLEGPVGGNSAASYFGSTNMERARSGYIWEGVHRPLLSDGERHFRRGKPGEDGHYYLYDTDRVVGASLGYDYYINKYIIKRSVDAVAPTTDTDGTCARDPDKHELRIRSGSAAPAPIWLEDVDCQSMCAGIDSKEGCTGRQGANYCDYSRWGIYPNAPSFQSWMGYENTYSAVDICKWTPN